MKKYKAVILDDYEKIRDYLAEALRARDFEVQGFSEAETLLTEVFDVGLPIEEQPDLVVVDLHLRPGKMEGMALLAELAERDVASEIMVLSGNLVGADLEDAVRLGAAAAFSKPFDDVRQVLRRMEFLAETGKRRRQFRSPGGSQALDASRCQRPVFLSYSSKDKRLASGLRRNLEARNIAVWYAPEALRVGDVWRGRLEDAIDQSIVFVALVTDNYLESKYCFGELMRFQRRLEIGLDPPPLILPVLAGLSEEGKKDPMFRPLLQDYQYVDISVHFSDALTLLLARIQTELARREIVRRDNKEMHSQVPTSSLPEKIA